MNITGLPFFDTLPDDVTYKIHSILPIDFFSPDFMNLQSVSKKWQELSIKALTSSKVDLLECALKVLELNSLTAAKIKPLSQSALIKELTECMELARDHLCGSTEEKLESLQKEKEVCVQEYALETISAAICKKEKDLNANLWMKPSPIVLIWKERAKVRLVSDRTILHVVTIELAFKGCFQLAASLAATLEQNLKPTAYHQIVLNALERNMIAVAIQNSKMYDHTKLDLGLPEKIVFKAVELGETDLLFSFFQERKRIKGKDLYPKIGLYVIDKLKQQGKADLAQKFQTEFSPKTT